VQALLLITVLLLVPPCAYPAERDVLIQEGFDDLSGWEPVHFPGIKEHSRYSIETGGAENYLAALSNSSASGIAYREEFRVYDYPRVRWRWKISNVYEKGDAASKEGDDYPIRVYIMFRYDPKRASLGERIKYGLARRLYGSYPPASSLNYIWANRARPERLLTSPYTDRSRMFVLESGASKAGLWVEEEVDILADFRAAFGSDPPEYARLAVMNDSDNTGESSASYIDYIEVFRYRPEAPAD
jgi:hypothetical protein